ncbi:MAG: hypothetical protein EOM23_10350, partial [Candidatus Moranbacteria bacterium]|nr:hypothetical protein [Candidatus Moranbacteria bacterium]
MKAGVSTQTLRATILTVRRWQYISSLLGFFLLIGAVVGFMSGWSKAKEENLLVLTFHGVTTNPIQPWEITYTDLLNIINGRELEIIIKEGAGAFVCGEETALIASLEGQRGTPRFRPPFPTDRGWKGHPSMINNVETF